MSGFGFGSPFSTPYYEGGASTALTPYVGEVALGGHAYIIDWSAEIPLRHMSIPILRQQQDVGESPGEQSINSEGLWRRFGESWHLGAGQERYDRKESSPFRFHLSQGVNVWNKWELSLLNDVEIMDADAATNQRMAVAGSYLYYTQGAALKYVSSIAGAPTTVTGTPATNATSIASNGNRIWTAHGADGVYMTVRNTATTVSHITGTVSLIAYVKNRVIAAQGPILYDVTSIAVGAAAPLPAALFTHGNTDWQWVSFAESQGFIYAGGYSGDKSLIYSLGITTDGTALSAPTVAAALPDGEILTCLGGYLGRFLAVGTNKGFRLAFVSEGGGLNLGNLIETPASVLCFEGQEEFIWFGYSSYSATATGLGRMSTNKFTDLDTFTPAYASDLMVEGQTNAVQDVVTFDGRRVFSITGVGVYAEMADQLVSSGYLETGQISYGMTEPKTALFVDLQVAENESMDSQLEVRFATDGGLFHTLSVCTCAQLETMPVGEKVGNEFEIRLIINRGVVDPTKSASILSWLLRVQPRPLVTNMIYATILLAPSVTSLTDTWLSYVTDTELDFIENLNSTKAVTTFQQNDRSYSVIVEDYELAVKALIDDTDGTTGFNGSCTLKLKRV